MKALTVVKGTIKTNPELAFVTKRDEYYLMEVHTKRKSGTVDVVPVLFARKSIDPNADYVGMRINIKGDVQSRRDDDKHLLLYVYAKEAEIYYAYDDTEEEDINEVQFKGTLKKSVFRKTPSGISIADVYLVHDRYFIPCIAWNNKAEEVSDVDKNTKIEIKARFQSRTYNKEINGMIEERIAYEISIYDLAIEF